MLTYIHLEYISTFLEILYIEEIYYIYVNRGELMDKKKQETLNRKKFDEKFNSVTQKAKPVNQNQEHNARSEAVEPKIRQV